MLPIEIYSNNALNLLRNGKDGDPVYVECRKVYYEIRNNPTVLKNIKELRQVGQALYILLTFKMITDIDVLQRISSLSYYLTSKAIKLTPNNSNLYKDRLCVLIDEEESFKYTVSSVVNTGLSLLYFSDAMQMHSNARSINKMQMYDYSRGGKELIHMAPMLENAFMKNMKLFMDINEDLDDVIEEGGKLHDRVYNYLNEQFIERQNLDL